ncbi:Aste57867_6965 [Aphanomyces stellatus]|uniref:Aste57867_5682 protein n=1 Tax=Aphanomyces stellatus TaxID=120398 RepID=A0A485KGA0_9STRA|nr:hypothetical protein As57867_006943 [Aphanomyces stellatus]KAF0709985.1 hypothetical protein As57867_005669 [Aphanomyces stellatus]VFT82722.1 Aste57867_5682 [Aphanomyces stellatus]VFT83917.1 Aste57867_6965 [Aphanomyces stellatus]
MATGGPPAAQHTPPQSTSAGMAQPNRPQPMMQQGGGAPARPIQYSPPLKAEPTTPMMARPPYAHSMASPAPYGAPPRGPHLPTGNIENQPPQPFHRPPHPNVQHAAGTPPNQNTIAVNATGPFVRPPPTNAMRFHNETTEMSRKRCLDMYGNAAIDDLEGLRLSQFEFDDSNKRPKP